MGKVVEVASSRRPRRFFSKLLFVTTLIVGSGCSSVQQFGNTILQTTGLMPGSSVVDASQSLTKAFDDLTPEEEYYFGRAVAAKILSIYPPYQDPRLNHYLNTVGLTLASYSDKPEVFGGYHFLVLDTDSINALAAPGGYVFVTRGLLAALPDEDTLASVLAHEIAHVVRGHGIQAVSQANLNKALSSLGQIAGTLNCAEILQQATAVFGGAVDDVVTGLLEKGYSRDQEREADKDGVEILWRTGYNPHALFGTLELISAKSRSEGGWMSTHPGAEERMVELADHFEERDISLNVRGFGERVKRLERNGRG